MYSANRFTSLLFPALFFRYNQQVFGQTEQDDSASFRRHLPLLFTMVLYGAMYFQVLGFGFVYDDVPEIVENPFLRRPLLEGMSMSQMQHLGAANVKGVFYAFDSYRPLRFLSYYIDYQLFGLAPGKMHLHNLILGLSNLVALWRVFLLCPFSYWVRFAVLFIFAFHPLQVESVAYISTRSDLQSALFVLVSFECALRYFKAGSLWAWGIGVLAFGGAMASKEANLLFPFFLLYGAIVFRSWRRGVVFGGSLLFVAAGWLLLRSQFLVAVAPFAYFDSLPGVGGVFVQALCLIGLPMNLSVLRPVLDWGDWWLTLIWFTWGLVGSLLLLRRPRGWFTVVMLGYTWFSIALLPAALAASVTGYFTDHYLYLAILGIVLPLVLGAEAVVRHRPNLAKSIYLMGGALGVMYLFLSLVQIPTWRSELSFAQNAVFSEPGSARAQQWMGHARYHESGCTTALPYFEKAVSLDPSDGKSLSDLAICSLARGEHAEGLRLAKKAVSLTNELDATLLYNLGLAELSNQKRGAACQAFQKALYLEPRLGERRSPLQELCAPRSRGAP
ncbi:MAG: hypothetical protein MK135_00390 [Polyangiaceae bacterium]|nr:hypothetical protein [Polyangiaceae bacterium]